MTYTALEAIVAMTEFRIEDASQKNTRDLSPLRTYRLRGITPLSKAVSWLTSIRGRFAIRTEPIISRDTLGELTA